MAENLFFTEPALQPVSSSTTPEVVSTDWRRHVPVLTGKGVRLRELRESDAASLFTMLSTEEVTRFISPPPPDVQVFERFIDWTLRQRRRGENLCFAVTLQGYDTAIGIFQVRRIDADFATAEWGFAIGSPFWGTGVFEESARLALNFVFDTLRVHRLEARATACNGRGNGALLKMGAVQEGLLRKSFLRKGEYLDQVMYSILAEDWKARAVPSRRGEGVQVH